MLANDLSVVGDFPKEGDGGSGFPSMRGYEEDDKSGTSNRLNRPERLLTLLYYEIVPIDGVIIRFVLKTLL